MDKLHNKGITSELDAWLTFLGCDEPDYIVDLITRYPEFKPMYADLYDMCLNIERVMNMFSKELAILDRNTVKYMIDELQEQLDAVNDTITEKDNAIAEKDNAIAEKDSTIAKKDSENEKLKAEIAALKAQLDKI